MCFREHLFADGYASTDESLGNSSYGASTQAILVLYELVVIVLTEKRLRDARALFARKTDLRLLGVMLELGEGRAPAGVISLEVAQCVLTRHFWYQQFVHDRPVDQLAAKILITSALYNADS